MDNFYSGARVDNITNGRISDIVYDGAVTYVTVWYSECQNCQRIEQSVQLIVNNSTRLYNQNGVQIPRTALQVGMQINASYSPASTRSIPPQALAYMIQIVERNNQVTTTAGLIFRVDYNDRSFTMISNGNPLSVTKYNVADNAVIFDRYGRPIDFQGLRAGMRVYVRHATFMTASIPPQTTAYEIQVR